MSEIAPEFQWDNKDNQIIAEFRAELGKTNHPQQEFIDAMAPLQHPAHKYAPKELNFDEIFKFIQKKIKDLKIKKSDKPEVMFVAGYPKSGKDTFIKQSFDNGVATEGTFYRDKGGIIDALKANPKQVEKFYKDPENRKTNLPMLANFITNELMRYAVTEGANIAWKSSGAEKSTQNTLATFKEMGYEVNLVHVDVNKETSRANNDVHPWPIPKDRLEQLIDGLDQNLPEMKTSNIFTTIVSIQHDTQKPQKEFRVERNATFFDVSLSTHENGNLYNLYKALQEAKMSEYLQMPGRFTTRIKDNYQK